MEEVWSAVTAKHPDLAEFYRAIAATVREPDAIYFDPDSTASRTTGARFYLYYKSGVLTDKLADSYAAVVVKVVIEQANRQGYVQTAYPSGQILPRLVREWKK